LGKEMRKKQEAWLRGGRGALTGQRESGEGTWSCMARLHPLQQSSPLELCFMSFSRGVTLYSAPAKGAMKLWCSAKEGLSECETQVQRSAQ
jgi:hypothetical protein